MTKALVVSIVLFLSLSSLGPIFAQEIPPGQEPGAQAERYKYDVEKEKERLEYKKPKKPEIEIEKEKIKPAKEGPSFILKEVKITGSTVFKEQELRKIYQPYLDKEVSFSGLQELAAKIEEKYKEKGYFTTTVYIPEQEIKGGAVEFRVAEGKLGRLDVEGNRWFSAGLIKKFIHVKKNEILNIKSLSRDILRINKNSDLEIKAVVSQGKEPQTSDISLKVDGKLPWHAGLVEDNRGSRLTGKFRSMLYLRSSNLSGLGDSVFFNSLYSGKSIGESISYSIPVGTYGSKFSLDITYFTMKLGEEFKSFDITGNTQIYSPNFSWELALEEDFEAYMNLGMDIKSIKKKMLGQTTASDQLRTPYFGFDFSKTDSGGQTTLSPRFDFGTSGFLGASKRNHPTSSRAGTGGYFFKYSQSLNRIQRLFRDSYASIRTQFQVASRTLASSEQFQLGGADSIRGYPEGDYLADTAGALNIDLVFPMFSRKIQPVLFADIGGGKLKKTLSGEKSSKFLAGAGGGIRLHFKPVFLRLEWAKAVGDKQTSGSGPSTFYFTFQSEI